MTLKKQNKIQKNKMQNNRNRRNDYKNSRKPETIKDIIPSSEILEKFEDALPGSVAQLIDMAEKEQRHRHNWQDRYLKSHNISSRIGKACGLSYNIALLYLIYNLINSGEKELALKLFSINAAVTAFVIIITTFERRVFSRRPRVRGKDDNRKRNNDKRDDRRENNENRRVRAA
ncbi:MAG: DUF2335 domain-containing protein [Proteobacteria bacterium]|nr:DUF2335 domain-containing protein [Pseudomonadota bacterium]